MLRKGVLKGDVIYNSSGKIQSVIEASSKKINYIITPNSSD
jgi:hypothetical protein